LSAASRIKYAYYAYFSKPKSERPLYREIRRRRPTRIVELGIAADCRTLRMLQVAARYAGGPVEYAGIDLFEARSAHQPMLSLKAAHKLLKPLADKVRLLPGDPYSALAAAANGLPNIDLMIISLGQDSEALAKAWFYVPRMLKPETLVLQEQIVEGEVLGTRLVPLQRLEIEAWAAAQTKARRRAA
jgi:hypothetical protein